MIDYLRTRSARRITTHLRRLRPLVTRAWAWLCAETDDPDTVRLIGT